MHRACCMPPGTSAQSLRLPQHHPHWVPLSEPITVGDSHTLRTSHVVLLEDFGPPPPTASSKDHAAASCISHFL